MQGEVPPRAAEGFAFNLHNTPPAPAGQPPLHKQTANERSELLSWVIHFP